MKQPQIDRIEPNRRRVIIGVNPRAGSDGTETAAEALRDELARRDFEVRLESDIEQICFHARREMQANRLRAVVAAGGDGTLALMANRLPPEMPLAILPQGTENLMAKHLEMPPEPHEIANVIQGGWMTRLDAGEANGQLFLVMCSCGFDADVVHKLHAERRGHIRHWAYAKPIINSIRKYRYPTISIQCDQRPALKAKWAFIFNVPRYALGLPIADHADPMDGQLDLCAFRGGTLFKGLMYLFAILARQHRRWRDTRIQQAQTIRLTARDRVPFQLDGDPGGFLPLELRVVPGRLRLLVTESWATERHLIQTHAASA